ncbi:hypothetical protein OTU49_015334 [Cherax quadricarinatus]|uniref:Uncharacterized protein n=1 Tax=Cherax quadricarinatus TaxID=27406 RepID=A0AAW0Y4E3_CHEQU
MNNTEAQNTRKVSPHYEERFNNECVESFTQEDHLNLSNRKNRVLTSQINISSTQRDTSKCRGDISHTGILFTNSTSRPATCQKAAAFSGAEDNSAAGLKMTSFVIKKNTTYTINKDKTVLSQKTSNCNRKDLSDTYKNKEVQALMKGNKQVASTGIFHKIFRSKSEDILSKDGSKNNVQRCSDKESSVVELLLTPALTRSLFAKSQSDDQLDKAAERPGLTKSSFAESQCCGNKEVSPATMKCPKMKKPFQSIFAPDSSSLGTIFKKKMKLRKSHNFTTDDISLPSHCCLEKKLHCQDLQTGISETKYSSLQKYAEDKEMYFPVATKNAETSKKGEIQRVYQVNQPMIFSASVTGEGNREYLHQRVLTNSIKDMPLLVNNSTPLKRPKNIEKGNSGDLINSENSSVAFETFTKKPPWFEKFIKSQLESFGREDKVLHNSHTLNYSSGSSVFSSNSDVTSQDGIINSSCQDEVLPDRNTFSESLNRLMKHKGQPEVHKRIAEKLSAVIQELDEERCIAPPSSPYPVSKISSLHHGVRRQSHSRCDYFLKPTNVVFPRPTSLSLDMLNQPRRNSAPMLSPIEEAKSSPSLHNASSNINSLLSVSSHALESQQVKIAPSLCSSKINAPSSCPLKANVPSSCPLTENAPSSCQLKANKLSLAIKSRSLDEKIGARDCTQIFPPNYWEQQPESVTRMLTHVDGVPLSVLSLEETVRDPCDLIHLTPKTYCDHYDNDSEVEYV